MKTQKEIQDRIDFLQQEKDKIYKLLQTAKVKFFKNVEMIEKLQGQVYEKELVIEALAWTLI